MSLQQVPSPRDVRLLRAKVAHRKPQRESIVQSRVRQEYLAGRVDRVEQTLVERVELGDVGRAATRPGSKANHTERDRRKPSYRAMVSVTGGQVVAP